MSATILAADDNPELLDTLATLLIDWGYTPILARNGSEACQLAQSNAPDLILLDINMPVMDGLAATSKIKEDPELRFIPVILLSAKGEIEDVIRGLSQGADDYIKKPYEAEELRARLQAALRIGSIYNELRETTRRNKSLQSKVEELYRFGNIIGRAPKMRELFSLIEKVKDSQLPVLLNGESGTGKELVASALHYNSVRKGKPFIAQNCSAFSDTLLESELFGHIKGSFTGALRDKAGLFEMADGGTLFLDEIGEMKPVLQAKLLRVLQDGTFMPVGGTKQKKVDVRVIAATHRDIEGMISDGSFREDLFYRLNVVRIKLPPLRERLVDIPDLIDFFLEKIAKRDGTQKRTVNAEFITALSKYSWPGNVRELENEIERVVLMSGQVKALSPDMLDDRIKSPKVSAVSAEVSTNGKTLPDAVEALERSVILNTLERLDWNKSEAARELGISRSNLIAKVQAFGLEQDKK